MWFPFYFPEFIRKRFGFLHEALTMNKERRAPCASVAWQSETLPHQPGRSSFWIKMFKSLILFFVLNVFQIHRSMSIMQFCWLPTRSSAINVTIQRLNFAENWIRQMKSQLFNSSPFFSFSNLYVLLQILFVKSNSLEVSKKSLGLSFSWKLHCFAHK